MLLKKLILYFILSLMFSFSQTSYALLNPAAVYCNALGYKNITEHTPDGDVAMCRLPDGRTVDAWKFIAGEVAQEYSYCVKNGYGIKSVNHIAYCILPDGSEVDVTKLMGLNFDETTCGDGSCGIPENYSTCPADCPSGGWDGYCDKEKDGKVDPDCAEGEDPDATKAGDLDGDGDIDRDDVNIVMSHRNQSAEVCPECDIDGDGTITVLDGRKLILMCTRPRCAIE